MDYLFNTFGFFSGRVSPFSAILDAAAFDDLSLASFSLGLPSTTCTFCFSLFLHWISHYYHSCAMIHSSLLCIFIHKCCIRAHLIGLSSVSCQKTTTTAGTVVQIRASYSTCSSISLLYLYVRYTQFFLGYFCNSTKACLLSLCYAIALLLTLPPVH